MNWIARNRVCALRVVGIVLLYPLFAFSSAPAAKADTIYTYTGQPFTNFSGLASCTNGVGACALSGTIDLASPVPANSQVVVSSCVEANPGDCSGHPPNVGLLSWSFTVGQHDTIDNNTLNSYSPADIFLELDSGANGQIVGWYLLVSDDHQGFMSDGPNQPLPGDTFDSINEGAFTAVPGTWTVTPEPSTLILLAIGFLSMAGARRWKARTAV
jgi:hypothetical protein